jgi:hypothetical protein
VVQAGARTGRRRGRLARVLPLMVLALLCAGCAVRPITVLPPPPKPTPPPRIVAKPLDCTQSPDGTLELWHALASADPGDKLCLLGSFPPSTLLSLTRSGTSSDPIVVESDGVLVAGIEIDADNVIVQGFNLGQGTGIKAQGTNIIIRDNDVRDAEDDGIRCNPCTGGRIVNNRVMRADGVGVVYAGSDGTIRDNDVSGSIQRSAADADGIGFAGTNLSIVHNYVHDISGGDDPAGISTVQSPHADCFRTADSAGTTISDRLVLIDNVCANVAGQCLTADGSHRDGVGGSSGQPALLFQRNYCQNGTDRAVYLVGYPHVVVTENIFSAGYDTAVLAVRGSTDAEVSDNTLIGQFEPYSVDPESASGLRHSGNISK